MTKTKLLIEETADVIQGISILGRGAGARPGGWPLEMVEISDFKDSSWLNSDRLKSEEAYGSSVEAAHIRPRERTERRNNRTDIFQQSIQRPSDKLKSKTSHENGEQHLC